MAPRPEVCVGAITVHDGRLLLVQRGHPPGEGLWSVPGGRVEPGEELADAVLRELAEETALTGTCGSLVGWVERIGEEHHFGILDFAGVVDDPDAARAGDDASDVAWVPLTELAARHDLVPGLLEFLRDRGVTGEGSPP
jgi:8-oxo-dGTP diphosphatase